MTKKSLASLAAFPPTIGYHTPLRDIVIATEQKHQRYSGLIHYIEENYFSGKTVTVGEFLDKNNESNWTPAAMIKNAPNTSSGGVDFVSKNLALYGLVIDRTYEEQKGNKKAACAINTEVPEAVKVKPGKGKLPATSIYMDNPVQIGDTILQDGTVFHLGGANLARKFSERVKQLIEDNASTLEQEENQYMPRMVKSTEIPYGVFVSSGVINKCKEDFQSLEAEFGTKMSAEQRGFTLRK